MKRIGYIDIMKGIAIITVVIGHYCSITPIKTLIWSVHMPLFVFISGLFYKQINLVDLVKKNIKRLLLPYVLVVMGILGVELLIAYIGSQSNIQYLSFFDIVKRRILSGIYALASNSTLHKPTDIVKVGAVWFLNALFIGFIFLHCILKIKHKIIQIILIFLLLIIACIQTYLFCIPFGLNYGCAFLIWLYLGYTINKYKKLHAFINISYQLKLFILSVWFIIVSVEYLTHHQFNIVKLQFPLFGLEFLGAFCGILSVANISNYIENHIVTVSETFKKLGRNTIWILCVHALDIELWDILSLSSIIKSIIDFNFSIFFIRVSIDILLAFVMKNIWSLIKLKLLSKSKN